MVSVSALLSCVALTSTAFAAHGNFLIDEASSIFVSKMAAHPAPGVEPARASAIAGQVFNAVADDRNVQAAITKSLQTLIAHRGQKPDAASIRSLVSTGAEAFNAYAQEPVYTSLIKFIEKNYLAFDWLAMYQDAAKTASPLVAQYSKYADKAMDQFNSFAQDPNGKAALQTMHSIGMRIANDVGVIHY